MADLLSSVGLTGTFYASTGPEGKRQLDDDELRMIATAHELGNHGSSHVDFVHLSRDQIEREIELGVSDLGRFGPVPAVIAPPRGKVNARVLCVIASLGLTVRTAPALARRRSPVHVLEPSFMFYPLTWGIVGRNALRRRSLPSMALLMAWRGRRRISDFGGALLKAAAEPGRCVHIWGHSHDVDELGLWNELEELFVCCRTLGFVPLRNGEALALENPTASRGHSQPRWRTR